jgi:hypothetical protein
MEERLLLYLEYHPQVAWYGRGDISSAFASTYKIATPLPTPFTISYLFEDKAHTYLPDAIGQFLDGRLLIAEAGMQEEKRQQRSRAKAEAARLASKAAGRSLLDWDRSHLVSDSSRQSGLFARPASGISRLARPFRGFAGHLALGRSGVRPGGGRAPGRTMAAG